MNGNKFTLMLKNQWEKSKIIKDSGSKNYSVQGWKSCHRIGNQKKRHIDYNICEIHSCQN